MKEDLSYNECLKEFKRSLEGGSEIDILIEGIIKNISTNRIRWFDVGIGEGSYLRKIVNKLEKRGFMIEVTGIDNDQKSVEVAKSIFPKGEIIYGDFFRTNLKGKFDVFSFNQSIYYFQNKELTIEKCLRNLAEGGLLLCVCWSKKDKIFQFYKSLFSIRSAGNFTSENFKELISKKKNIYLVWDKLFRGKVNFKRWKNQKNLEKNFYVISRIPPKKRDLYKEYMYVAKKLIERQKNSDTRVNGIIIAKKSYKISNFDKEKIKNILKERFPNYTKKIFQIKGDLEALFMSSWERESEYLSEYISSGRVLEICCGAGLKSVILAKRHKVVAIDINQKRLNAARKNATLFGVAKNIEFKNINAENLSELKNLGNFDAIYIDVDWRENLSDPIKKHSIDPFKTRPRTDILYNNLKRLYSRTSIIFKISPFARVKDMTKLDPCIIEELYIDQKFLSYNIYFDPEIKKSRWQVIHLFNKKVI